MCVIPMIFCDFEKEIDANRLNVKFLNCYYSKFCFEIMQLYDEVKSLTDCFLQQEYAFGGRDQTTGETQHVHLSETIQYSESIKIAQLEADKLSVSAEFTHTMDLSVN